MFMPGSVDLMESTFVDFKGQVDFQAVSVFMILSLEGWGSLRFTARDWIW